MLRLSRRGIVLLTSIGCLALFGILLRPHYCVEESSCLVSLVYLRDSILQNAGLKFTEATTIPCTKDCDKALVIGHKADEDVSWVEKRLPEYADAESTRLS